MTLWEAVGMVETTHLTTHFGKVTWYTVWTEIGFSKFFLTFPPKMGHLKKRSLVIKIWTFLAKDTKNKLQKVAIFTTMKPVKVC